MPAADQMHFDEVYDHIGEGGLYQWSIFAIITGLSLFALDVTTMVFVGAPMDHWCHIESLNHLSDEQQKYVGIPLDESSTSEYSSCRMFALNFSAYDDEELGAWNRSLTVSNETEQVDCDAGWNYDHTVFISTINSRFDLVCGEEYLNPLVSTIYMIGSFFGSIVAGLAADRFGRVPSMALSLAVKMIGILMSSLANNYALFVVGRFVLGFGSIAVYITSYVLLMESIGPRHRGLAGCSLQMATSLGFMLQSPIAYGLRNDQIFQLVAMAPIGVFFLAFIFVKESMRWLIVRGNYEKAENILHAISKINRKPGLPEGFDVRNIGMEEETARCTILLSSKRLRKRTIILHIIWFTTALVWYSLSLNTANLAGNIFINGAVSGGTEVVSTFMTIFIIEIEFFGRRLTTVFTLFVAGAACLFCILAIFLGFDGVVTILAIMAKAFTTSTWTTLFIFASEIYPTEVRNAAIGSSTSFSCLAMLAAPYIGAPIEEVWAPLPYVILGVFLVVTAILALRLPETLGKPLPDTAAQAEQLTGKKAGMGEALAGISNCIVVDDNTSIIASPSWTNVNGINANDSVYLSTQTRF